MMKSCIFVLLVFSLSLCSSFGAVPTSLKQLDSGRKRLLDDRRGGLDDIPERNVDDDLVSAGDDAVDDGQGEYLSYVKERLLLYVPLHGFKNSFLCY